MRWLSLVCRLVVGGVFIWASLDKLAHPAEFAKAIHHYRIVPYALLHPAALLLPMVEAVAGVALVIGWQRRGAALACAGMLLVFLVAIGSALVRGLDISCGCFNTDGGHAVGLDLFWRDLLLLIACLPPLLAARGGFGLDRDR
ncbi:MAG: DoxX family membrane protein [bacterium]|nr:DoxX family membrane protein [bacterium]